MLIVELGPTTERFRTTDEAPEDDVDLVKPTGSLAVMVMARLIPPQAMTQAMIAQRQRRLSEWSRNLASHHAAECASQDTAEGIRALNAQLWEWSQRGNEANWNVVWNDAFVDKGSPLNLDPHDHSGPTDLFGADAIMNALRFSWAYYSPPLPDGGRVYRLDTVFSALLTSTLEAFFLKRLGLCRHCGLIYRPSSKHRPLKRCPNCRKVKADTTVHSEYRAAIMRISRLSDKTEPEKKTLKHRCHVQLIKATNGDIRQAKAIEQFLRIAPERKRGRPRKKQPRLEHDKRP